MTQDHTAPAQKALDCYISQAKELRSKTLAALAGRLFRLPATLMQRTARASNPADHERVEASNRFG